MLSDMKLISFRSQKISEMSNFIQRKKTVIQKLRVEVFLLLFRLKRKKTKCPDTKETTNEDTKK